MIDFGPGNSIPSSSDVVLTGRKRAGKTHIATNSPHEVLAFADPMYRVCEGVLGHTSKEDPDVRKFLRNLGTLGRGESELPRILRNRIEWAGLQRRLQRDGANVTGMGTPELWKTFGREDFWVDLLEARVEEIDGPVAIQGARFPREVARFTERDFRHLHVMASEETRRARLQENGETPSPDAKTEELARGLDRIARDRTTEQANHGIELALPLGVLREVATLENVVWSDERREPNFPSNGEAYDATADEPTPEGTGRDVAALVHEDIEARVEQGEEEYGERLTTHNGRDALSDAYQEALDFVMYLRQNIEETR